MTHSLCQSVCDVFPVLCELDAGHTGLHSGLYRERGTPFSSRVTWSDLVSVGSSVGFVVPAAGVSVAGLGASCQGVVINE